MTEHDNQSSPATNDAIIASVRELIEMMNNGGIGALDLRTDQLKIKLRSEAVALASATPMVNMAPAYAMPSPAIGHSLQTAEAEPTENEAAAEPKIDGHVVTSPMIGTFYSASAPGEPSYVQVGDEVELGQVIGIIEAMKIMNEITADKSGVVTEILVDNAEAVEYGSPLIRISSSARLD